MSIMPTKIAVPSSSFICRMVRMEIWIHRRLLRIWWIWTCRRLSRIGRDGRMRWNQIGKCRIILWSIHWRNQCTITQHQSSTAAPKCHSTSQISYLSLGQSLSNQATWTVTDSMCFQLLTSCNHLRFSIPMPKYRTNSKMNFCTRKHLARNLPTHHSNLVDSRTIIKWWHPQLAKAAIIYKCRVPKVHHSKACLFTRKRAISGKWSRNSRANAERI